MINSPHISAHLSLQELHIYRRCPIKHRRRLSGGWFEVSHEIERTELTLKNYHSHTATSIRKVDQYAAGLFRQELSTGDCKR